MFEEAKSEFRKISDHFIFKPKILVYLGDIAVEQEKYAKALNFYHQVKGNSQFEKFDIDEAKVLHNVGLCYLHLTDYKNAEINLVKSLSLQEAKKDTIAIIGSYMDIAGIYYEQYKDNLAIPYYKKAYMLSIKIRGNYFVKKNASLNMAVVEENRKNYSQSLKYRKESEAWTDSLNNQSRIWSLAQLEKRLAIKSKQSEVNMLITQNKLEALEKNRILYITILLSAILVGGVYFYVQKLKTNRIILDQKTRLDESNTAKDVLFSIVSHDLRSYINSLKSMYYKMQVSIEHSDLVRLKDEIKTGSFIADSTHNLLNNLLHWALMQTNQLYFNQESVNLYMITEQVVYNYKSLMIEKNIFFENSITGNLKVKADQESLKIILRNVLDNAIKYTDQGGQILIYENELSDNYYSITVEDNGKGMTEELQTKILDGSKILTTEKNKAARGLGLHLCKSLVKKNLGLLKLESRINLGTKITISLLKA
ncbi:ATP-binding protein [Epilithonimonas sp. UC225_85]|uniref:ATP-binding protein n=1 Tax=Epilithonimonas sp. UC225_85 TaxID=3350167 RepID=UPI0036D350C5